MNKVILKNSIKEIKKSYRRFLSLLLIALLGVGFFAGVKATTPDMQKTIDTYFDKENLFDIKVVSTLGLTDDDVKAIKQIQGISEVYSSYSEDVFINVNDVDIVVKTMELTENINNVRLVDGRLPNAKKECVMESLMLEREGLKIGDKIKIKEELDEDEDSSFYETDLVIVGSVDSPLFISADKGTSTLGSGKLAYYIYTVKENITEDYYTEIYAKVENAKQLDTTSKEYSDYIDQIIDNVEKIKAERQKARYDSLINEANEKLDDAQKELDEKKAEGEADIADAEKQIRDGEKDLADGEKKLQDAKDEANREISDAEIKLTNATQEFERSLADFSFKKQEAERQFAEAESKKKELEASLPGADMFGMGDAVRAAIAGIDASVQAGQAEILNGQNAIGQAQADISNGWNELNSKKAEAEEEFAKAEKDIEDAKKKIADGKKELEDAKKEFDEKVGDAQNKLLDARQKLADIEEAKWYILGRSSNNGYDSFVSDCKNIERLGYVFPILFFIIAILISLTSMTRMVEEQRIELGTMKALGYSNASICIKYVIYAFVASVIGGVIGMLIGFNMIPSIIISMYQMMYPTVKEAVIEFNTYYAITGLGFMLICTIGATLYSVIKELMSMPAMLMRPKPPKSGKRVFLEKVPFIWNRLGFTEKVTIRNMFRYKKRFLMTIVGIMGCTALILTGFSIKDSISNLMNLQYDNVYNYDTMIGVNSSLTEAEIDNLILELEKNDKIEKCTKTRVLANEAKGKADKKLDVQIIVTENKKEFEKFIKLNDAKTLEEKYLNDDEIFITEKIAKLLNIQVGDVIDLSDNDGNEYKAKVGAIVENYVFHYVYMTSDLYEKIYGEEYSSNVVYVQTVELDGEAEDALNKELLKNSNISSLTSVSYLKENLAKTLKALNKVVYVLIVSAGLLAFVVLYNLANVNISERIRELATIKVLGFYDKEVYDYVTKEIILLTIIGIILGLFGGYWLSVFILKTCETEPLIFKIVSLPSSYLISAGITVIFTVIVNFMTFFVLKKVDMIESLKSVE